MIYDIIILGGGISGLYSAYKLLQKDKTLKILILEKNNYLGGRMKTYQKTINGITYYQEEGAWRFNSNHKLLLKLIHELGLKDNLRNLDLKKDFIPSTKYDEKFINFDPIIYINKIIEYSKKDEKSTIQSYTLKEYSKKILKKDESKFFIDSFGYYKILDINAYDGILLLESGLKFNLKFYTIYPGVSIIIDKIKSKILENNGEIILNTNVLNIDFNEINRLFTINTNNGIYTSKKCILALPKQNLIKFSILKSIKKDLESIEVSNMSKIFAIFNKKHIWFKNIGHVFTNNKLRQIIPRDKENGSILLSYCDGKFAEYWKNLKDKKKDLFLQEIKKNIFKIFKIKIQYPLFTKFIYWNNAAGYWKKNKDSTVISKKILHPYKDIPLYICGENYSKNQAWMEGALNTSKSVVNKIIKNKYVI